MIITFSGLDGSGKTTYLNESMKYFKKKGYKTRYIHLIKSSLTNILNKKIINKISKKTSKRIDNFEDKDKFYFKYIVYIKTLTILLDIFIFLVRRLFYSRSTLVFMDRYFYDALIQVDYLTKPNKFTKFMFNIIPKANIMFLIDANPKIAYRRKPEFNIDYFNKKKKYYDKLKNIKGMTVIKDNKLSLNKSRIINIIYKEIN